jgi:hypothetical protein
MAISTLSVGIRIYVNFRSLLTATLKRNHLAEKKELP